MGERLNKPPEPQVGWDKKTMTHIIKVVGPWVVSVAPMIFNDRILLTYLGHYPHSVHSAYCYDKGGSADLAAQAWDPTTDRRPVGYKKIAYEDPIYTYEDVMDAYVVDTATTKETKEAQ